MTLLDTIAMVAALAGLVLGMSGFLLGKRAVKMAQKDRLANQQPMRPHLNGHSSLTTWRRAAANSEQASQRRRNG